MERQALDDIWLVDAHCHAFDLDAAAGDLATHLTLSTEPLAPGLVEATLLFRRVIVELADFLGCEPNAEAVGRERRRRFDTDPNAYVRSLFDDARVETMLIDDGFPVDPDHRSSVDLGAFASIAGPSHRTIARIEPVARRSIDHGAPFAELIQVFEATLRDAVAGGAVGLKSEIAYYTGLDIEPTSRAAAERGYDAIRRGGNRPERGKALLDHLFILAMEIARQLDVPVQIHTGMGDGPEFDMTTARPILLRRLLYDADLRRTKLVLTHAGYPWVEESAWLANQYDNIHIDISEMIPFASSGITAKILGLLELAPTTKLMYGSDGLNAPELHWFAARTVRRALSSALDRLEVDGWLTPDEGVSVARAILHDNATRLYRL